MIYLADPDVTLHQGDRSAPPATATNTGRGVNPISREYLRDPDVTLWQGDVLDSLGQLADASIDCVVTSPPYW